MPKQVVQKSYVEVAGKKVPVSIHLEHRRSIRFYLGKTGAILRLPAAMPTEVQKLEWERFRVWVKKKVAEKGPGHAFGRTHHDGDELTVGNRTYRLQIVQTENKTHSAKLIGPQVIELRLSAVVGDEQRAKATRHLLSRVIAQDFQAEMERRVRELNHLHFRKPVNSVNLKYNRSNWGSCSTKGNINLSTCLLFAPDDVIDYVIIHELAHLVEMNHSPRFWTLVEDAMPDYTQKKKWLRDTWQRCNF